MYCTTPYILFNFFFYFLLPHSRARGNRYIWKSKQQKSRLGKSHSSYCGDTVAVSSEYKRKGESQLLGLGPLSRLSVEAFSDPLHISNSRRLGNQSQQGLQGVCHRQNYSRPGLICPHGPMSPHSQSEETTTKGKPPGLRKPWLWQTHSLHSTSQLLTVRVESCTETSGGMQEMASPTSSTFFLNVWSLH